MAELKNHADEYKHFQEEQMKKMSDFLSQKRSTDRKVLSKFKKYFVNKFAVNKSAQIEKRERMKEIGNSVRFKPFSTFFHLPAIPNCCLVRVEDFGLRQAKKGTKRQ